MGDASVRTVLGDVAVATLGRTNLGERVLPRRDRAADPGLVEAVLVTNPARWLSGTKNETSGGNPR